MSPKQILSNSSFKGGFHLNLQPPQAWTAILALVIFSAMCILAGAGSILRLVFPVGSLAVGVFLYLRYPILYLGFSWWLWFLTPWLRRLIDYRSGWDANGVILLSPYLVALISLVTFLRHLPSSYRQGSLPFVLACTGVFYGILVGLINSSPMAVARSLLDWLTPVLVGFHLFANWRDYPKLSHNIQRTFLWGVLVTGVYGVVQYLVLPEWDRLWLINTKLTSSMGNPEPLGIRVWSTMNASGPFASVMMAGLLLLLNNKESLRIPAAAAGYLAFLLTSVRTMWGAWFVGVLLIITSLKANLQMRLIVTMLVMAVCIFPLTTIDSFSPGINSRFQSFSNLEEDDSYNVRAENYKNNLSLALSNSLGNGIGSAVTVNDNGKLESVVIDSGILDTFFTLGWFGAILYLGGMILLIFSLFQYSEVCFDSFMAAARAISFSIFTTLISSSSMIGVTGVVFWGFLGMGMAGHKYYQHQRTRQT